LTDGTVGACRSAPSRRLSSGKKGHGFRPWHSALGADMVSLAWGGLCAALFCLSFASDNAAAAGWLPSIFCLRQAWAAASSFYACLFIRGATERRALRQTLFSIAHWHRCVCVPSVYPFSSPSRFAPGGVATDLRHLGRLLLGSLRAYLRIPLHPVLLPFVIYAILLRRRVFCLLRHARTLPFGSASLRNIPFNVTTCLSLPLCAPHTLHPPCYLPALLCWSACLGYGFFAGDAHCLPRPSDHAFSFVDRTFRVDAGFGSRLAGSAALPPWMTG